MKIGIDIDDTITLTQDTIKKYKNKYTKKHNLDSEASLSKEHFLDFMTLYGKKIYADIKYKSGAAKYIKKLYKEGNTIYFVTQRREEDCPNIEKYTIYSLNKNKIPYHGIMFDASDKAASTKKLELDVFIDDRVKILDQFDNSGQSIYLIQMLKPNPRTSDYVKAKNWRHAYKLINNYKEEEWKTE